MKTLLTALFLLVPVLALAADGDAIGGADTTKGSFESASFVFCDTKTSSDSTCDEFDLNVSGRGMPDYWTISRDTTTSCTADVTVAINGQTTTGGTEHVITTINDADTAARIEGPYYRFIDADLSNMTACTDVDVNITLYFKKH